MNNILDMKKHVPVLSKGLLLVGFLMILTGAGWGVRQWIHRPADPQFTDAGAVVLAVTAAVERPTLVPPTNTVTVTPTPANTSTPTTKPSTGRGQTAEPPTTTPSPTVTRPPTVTATPSPTPRPTDPPAVNPPTRIVAEAIGLDGQVTTMAWTMIDRNGTFRSQWVVPKNAAGWHVNSALPGHVGNTVLSGHHNIDGKVFRYVVDLEPGDRITLYADDRPYSYWVTEKYILAEAGMPVKVRRQNAQWILPTDDERLTLVTCWPYEWPGNTHRVIVVARPAEYFWALGQDVGGDETGGWR